MSKECWQAAWKSGETSISNPPAWLMASSTVVPASSGVDKSNENRSTACSVHIHTVCSQLARSAGVSGGQDHRACNAVAPSLCLGSVIIEGRKHREEGNNTMASLCRQMANRVALLEASQ